MTKEETIAKLKEAAGNSNYGQAVVKEFEAHFDDDAKKYGQTLADRIDDRIGVIKGWAEKDEKEGNTLKAAAEMDKVAVLEAMKKAL